MDAKGYELAKRARELLVSQYTEFGIELQAARLMAQGHQPGGVHYSAVKAIIEALTPPEGHVVVTRNEAGSAVAVTRQDDEGRILSVIAEFVPPEGYVLVPVEPTDEMMMDACKTFITLAEMKIPSGKLDPYTVSDCIWAAMIAARQ